VDVAKLNAWFTLLTNVAVVIGIIALAVELNQNNELLRSESRQALQSNDQASLVLALDHIDLYQKIWREESLSEADQYRLGFMFTLDLRNREFEYAQFLNGALDQATWENFQKVILINHAGGRGRAWWDNVGRHIAGPNFVAMTDELLDGAAENNVYEAMGSWDNGSN